jgi:Na+/proline symporter
VATLLCLGSLSILAGQLIAMAWAFNVVLGLPKLSGCLLAGAVLVAYFSRGGLVASAWVNLLELAVLLTGFVLALPYAWSAAGGWEAMRRAAGSESSQAFGSFVGMGWGPILGLSLILVPSFIVSPGLVQKTFGARSARAARWAVLANAAALAVFAFIPATLGMCARALRPDLAHPELALPALMSQVLPPWVGGLALAALFAAEISTADAVLFMLSTSFSRDLYQRFLRPGARTATFSERRLSSTSEAGLTPGEEFDDGGAGARTAAFSERRLSSTSEAGLTPSEEFDDGGAGARTPIDDDADDARLLKVGRWTSAVSGFVGVALAVLLPSVVDALKVFYGIMTVALFVPLLGGLLLPKPTAARARAAVWAGTLSMAVCLVVFRGSALASWLPVAVGIALAAGVFMWRGIGKA